MENLSFLHAISSALPENLSAEFQSLRSGNNDAILENFIRFITGGSCTDTSLSKERQEQWISKQMVVRNKLSELVNPSNNKRQRGEESVGGQDNKRQKIEDGSSSQLSGDDPPLFTLKSISTTSPVRKKVDITIHKGSIRLHHPTTNALEHASPLSSLTRGFLVPTRGKTKPHWTIILLSNDIPEKGKGATNASSSLQVIFGLDALSTSATGAIDHAASDKDISIKKGDETLPYIRTLLSHLNFTVLEPSVNVFKSAFPGNTDDGVPGVEAYRGAKAGSLWFMKEGILWGDAKPCEFWPVGDLINKSEGLRMISATGRTCTLILTRKTSGEVLEEDEEDVGEETQFGLIDAKEQDGINKWVKQHRHLFGKTGEEGAPQTNAAADAPEKPKINNSNPTTLAQAQFDSDDDEDADFEASSEDEETENSSSEDNEDDADADADGEEDEAEEEEDEVDEPDEVDDEALDPKHHPLLRPGAMPKMSKAAMNMVVDMVEGDLARTAARGDSDMEEDELDD
ncbi:hypothetical protein VNI00_005925 [Paramarasmius palmivorus]|uniref:Histone chaperone RTT106/FACT complex subunit SPT16-like middle domain-containing protein n=1 Tax=Paramarasmius palmivorus TaxID=297713 RepID=A0AAW0DCV5_9AGAR